MPQENKLNDLEYCVRKGIGTHALKLLRNGMGKTQQDVADYLGVSQSLVSKWERRPGRQDHVVTSTTSNHEAPTMEQLLQLCAFLETPFARMVQIAIDEEARERSLFSDDLLVGARAIAGPQSHRMLSMPADPKGPDHFELIRKLQRSVYFGSFLSEPSAGESQPRVEHFLMETSVPLKTGAVPAFMHVVGKAGNGYRCNIVSPPNQRHLYVYMRQDSAGNDRAILVYYGDKDIQGLYACGSGAMLSTNRKSGAKRLQWVAIVRICDNDDELTVNCEDEGQMSGIQRELSLLPRSLVTNEADRSFVASDIVRSFDDAVREHLMRPLPNPEGWRLDFDCLKDRQDEFYKKVCLDGGVANELGSCWRKTHHKE